MEEVEDYLDNLLQRHCHCGEGENRIMLESISICPRCESIFSTLVYEIPSGKLKDVLMEMDAVMGRHGITRLGTPQPVSFCELAGDDRSQADELSE